MNCNCNPSEFNNQQQRFDNQIVIELPVNQIERQRRKKDGLSTTVCIDPCILDKIIYLWLNGIQTMGCCCGHNVMPGFVNVADQSIQKMLDMGYTQWHQDSSRKDTFLI